MALDNQWLILDNMGKLGVDAANINVYPANPIGHTFNILGVAQAQPLITPNAANALFVIYRDGEHYNSRLPIGTPAYFSGNIDLSTILSDKHDLISAYASTNNVAIDNLYLTNIYEKDDPPHSVRIGNGSGAPGNGVYSFGTTNPRLNNPPTIVTASHSVTPGKDITLVIDHSLVLQNIPMGNNYFLSFKDVRDRNTGLLVNAANINLPIFQLSNFANNQMNSIISQGAAGLSAPGVVRFDPHAGNYTYINLRPAAPGLNSFFPKANDPNLVVYPDYWEYSAVFNVWSDLHMIPIAYDEPIRLI